MNLQAIKNLQVKVEDTLRTFPQTRNSDILLTRQIIHSYLKQYTHQGKDKKWWYREECFDMVREDNVKRVRAKLNERGLYLPDNLKVREARNINEEAWRKYIGANPEMREVIETGEDIQRRVLQPPLI